MTDREKLVELLDIIIQPGQKTLGDIADHLIANGVTVQEWRDAKTDPPESGAIVLLYCGTKLFDGRVVGRYVCDGYYAAKHSVVASYKDDDIACEYSEEDDEYYLIEGWYEVIRNWDDYNSVVIEDCVFGWHPMPEPPKEE